MSDRPGKTDKPKADAPVPTPAGSGGWTSRIDFQRLAAGIVLLGVSLYLLIAQGTAPAGSDTSLLSGPMGMALNIGGIVAGAWVLWTAWRR
jgi:hypothetical protein